MHKIPWLKNASIAAFTIIITVAWFIVAALAGDLADQTTRLLTVIATAFGIATYAWFLLEIIVASDADMGKFSADRNSIIIGLILMGAFFIITLVQSFASIHHQPRPPQLQPAAQNSTQSKG